MQCDWKEGNKNSFLKKKSTWATQHAWTFTLSVGRCGQGNCYIKTSLFDIPVAFIFPEQLRGLHPTVRECKPYTCVLTYLLCYTGLDRPTWFSENHDFFFQNTRLVWKTFVPLSSHAPFPSLQTPKKLLRTLVGVSRVWRPDLLPWCSTVGPRGQVT